MLRSMLPNSQRCFVLEKESMEIKKMCRGLKGMRVLNVCSSDEEFYQNRQPYIWKNVMEPLLKENTLVNLDIKLCSGVDIACDCRDMREISDGTYDVVLFCSGIEHMPEPERAIGEIRRVLKKSGFAILSAPGVYPKHEDPIDTMLRLPDRASWEVFLGGHWNILEYRSTRPEPALPFYAFDRKVYATIIKCRPNDGSARK